MAEQNDSLEKDLDNLYLEYRGIGMRLDEVAFRILASGGTLPSEAECEAAIYSAKRLTPSQKRQVYILEVDWRRLIIDAMKLISNPCALKSISEQIVSNNKSFPVSTVHNHVRFYINALIEAKEVGELPRGERKYYLIESSPH